MADSTTRTTLLTHIDSQSTWDDSKWTSLMKNMSGPSRDSSASIVERLSVLLPFTHTATALDIGTGTGVAVQALLDRHGADLPSTARVIASDVSSGMIKQVQMLKDEELAKGNKVWSRVEPLEMDAQDLNGIANASVSHVLASSVLFTVPEPRKALMEIMRVLQSGGAFAMTSWQSNEWVAYPALISTVRPDLTAPKIDGNSAWATPQGAMGELKAVGFQNAEAKIVDVHIEVEDLDEFPALMFKIPMMQGLLEQLREGEKDEVFKTILKKIKEEHKERPVKLGGKVVLASGRK